jgi:hypothetical protein
MSRWAFFSMHQMYEKASNSFIPEGFIFNGYWWGLKDRWRNRGPGWGIGAAVGGRAERLPH